MHHDSICEYQSLDIKDSANQGAYLSPSKTHQKIHACSPPRNPQETLKLVRDAYKQSNVEASRLLHKTRNFSSGRSQKNHTERHNSTSSEYLKAAVFGGLDGIVTIFAIVAGCVGAHLTPTQTIIVGLCNLLADAVSMGFGEYVSASTESDFTESERKREIWEVDNFPDEEKREMLDIYITKHHFSREDAETMVALVFKYKDFCISHMMAEELGILIDDESPGAFQRGAVMFTAFTVFGMIPLLGYSVCYFISLTFLFPSTTFTRDIHAFFLASFLSCITLFGLGVAKATFIAQSRLKAGLQVMTNGVAAGTVAFAVGLLLQRAVGTNNI